MNDNAGSRAPSIKVLVAYHTPSPVLANAIMMPIHVGRALANPETKSALAHMPGDDSGDSISCLNPYYSEMTSVYWAWKNYTAIGNPDYIGFAHYRRILGFGQETGSDFAPRLVHVAEIQRFYAEAVIQSIVKSCDICVASPIDIKPRMQDADNSHNLLNLCTAKYGRTVIGHYCYRHNVKDLSDAMSYVAANYPGYKETIPRFLSMDTMHTANMFIMKRDIFFEYAPWIFAILGHMHAKMDYTNLDPYQTRAVGFLAERLTSLFLENKKKTGNTILKYIPGLKLLYRPGTDLVAIHPL
ncbi:DUF4422 domain-containing protein [Desulfovibrio sp. OttesenSCG-928-C06]|nr:DUF4422 domain-containing protein [Desulfovibrio sp. OttesenSCG-928-C06]